MTEHIHIKRAYDAPAKTDGYRVLIDRLWPRGMTREELHYDVWAKDLAPSDELRKWFGHEVDKWPKFQQDYKKELSGEEQVERMRALIHDAGKKPITLVYTAKDTEHNNAVVLAQVMNRLY